MAQQNIYDDPVFFAGYQALRQNRDSANERFELPALLALLPDLAGRRVLDLGCGDGGRCARYAAMGAGEVVGVDISEKMLAEARRRSSRPQIRYLHLPMEELAALDGPFDLAVSSLAIHYVQDFPALAARVFGLLAPGGLFVFSQENPLNTCFTTGSRWTTDAQGNRLYAHLSNYSTDGERESAWFVEHVKKYHRTFSSLLNTLIEAGFLLEKLAEPAPTPEMLREHPECRHLLHKPDFLLVRARKPAGTP